MISFNQKETGLLQDQKKQEELCVKKYQSFAQQAQEPQLKQLFNKIGSQEQQHLNSINSLLNGQLPNTGGQNQQTSGQQGQTSGQQGQTNSQQGQQSFPPIQSGGSTAQNDKDMCDDLLSTEKYVSSTYNTAIFEFRDPNVRQVLAHIQKEEQGHGEQLYAYMASHGMYNAQ